MSETHPPAYDTVVGGQHRDNRVTSTLLHALGPAVSEERTVQNNLETSDVPAGVALDPTAIPLSDERFDDIPLQPGRYSEPVTVTIDSPRPSLDEPYAYPRYFEERQAGPGHGGQHLAPPASILSAESMQKPNRLTRGSQDSASLYPSADVADNSYPGLLGSPASQGSIVSSDEGEEITFFRNHEAEDDDGIYIDRAPDLSKLNAEQRSIAQEYASDLDDEPRKLLPSLITSICDWRKYVQWRYWRTWPLLTQTYI